MDSPAICAAIDALRSLGQGVNELLFVHALFCIRCATYLPTVKYFCILKNYATDYYNEYKS